MVEVWSKPIKVFHSLLLVSIVALFLTEDFKQVHQAFGFFVLFLVIFRIIYGLTTKNQNERLSGFFHSPKKIISFFISVLKMKEEKFSGHNPLAGIVMFVMLIVMIALVISGSVGYAMKEEEGILTLFVSHNFELGKKLLNAHHNLSNILLALIGFHLIGVAVSSFLTKENLAKRIFSYK